MSQLAIQNQTSSIALAPQSLEQAERLAEIIARSSFAPKSYQGKAGDVLVAIIMGAEVGLSPMQAIQNVAVINGRPSIWGDAALALCKAHASYEWCKEWVEGDGENAVAHCQAKRKGEDAQLRSFSVADAKKAQLWGKQGPWQQYPARMLQLRARGFAIRDVWPDALRGLITAEEAQDYPSREKERASDARVVEMRLEKREQQEPAPQAPVVEDTMEVLALLSQIQNAQSVEELDSVIGPAKALDEALRKRVRDAFVVKHRELSSPTQGEPTNE